MKKTIIGIVFFLVQISIAIYFNQTIDLLVIAGLAVIFTGVILYNYRNKKYQAGEM